MSQLHPDRLLDEGPVSAPSAATRVDPAAAPSSGRAPAPAVETSIQSIPTPRSGDARPQGTTPGGPAPRLAAVADLADLTVLAEEAARAGIGELPDEREDAPAPAILVTRIGRRRATRRSAPPAPARRPALYLAAALVGALGLGLVTSSEHTAQAEAAAPVGESVSVAEELGLDTRSSGTEDVAAAIQAEVAAELEEVAVSRTAREDEQAAAAQAQAEADRLAAEAAAEAARPQAVLPVAGARLTSQFGARWGRTHAGIDLAAPMRTPEYAAMDGVVLEAGPASGYGNVVYIQHENGDVTVYGHMEEILVTPGQVVRAGDTIALLGNRGQSTGPHLHFEVQIGGLTGPKVDPIPWLRERGVQI